MRLNGEWRQCDDGIIRPVIFGEVLTGDGVWETVEFLIDTGADRTVFSAEALELLNLPQRVPTDQIGGIGGVVGSVTIVTSLQLRRDDGNWATFRSEFAACLNYEILDMSVLGRDILNLFAVIVDRPANVVTMLGQTHTYTVKHG